MSDLSLSVIWRDPQQAGVSLNKMVIPWSKDRFKEGHALEVQIRTAEDAKTDAQRRYYHGIVLKQIAEQARPNGVQFPLPVWKEHFRKEYLGFKTVTYTDPMTGKKHRRRVRQSTEGLGNKGYAKLTLRVTAFAVTELGVVFDLQGEHIDPDTGEIYGH